MTGENYKKISFRLEQDEDGYPPDQWESLWASKEQLGLYCIDNIPFYAKGISSGDVVSAEGEGEALVFKELVHPSLNSVFRIYVSDVSDVQAARDSFRNLGCETELSNLPKLVAIEIPGSVAMEPVARLLAEGANRGRWEYEEGAVRHRTAV